MNGILEKAWQSYSDACFEGVEVGEVQVRETRLAFYAGMWDMFRLLTDVSDTMDEDAAVVVLEGLLAEFEDYKKRELG